MLSEATLLNFTIIDDKENKEQKSDATNVQSQYRPPNFKENAGKPDAEANKDLPYHIGVICDNCEGEIYGYRYKCVQCYDFDLCMKCESKSVHNEHVMFRLPEPRDVCVYKYINTVFTEQNTIY